MTAVITPDDRTGLRIIEVSRQDYLTCREPVPGTGHCNTLVSLYRDCPACAYRKAQAPFGQLQMSRA